MKLLRYFLPFQLTLLQRSQASDSVTTPKDDCPPVQYYDAEYHLDTACDKRGQNKYVDSLQKGLQSKQIQENGIYHVPDKLTRQCPSQVLDLFQHFGSHASDPIYHYGYSTIWIVHNKASVPVVISWVDRTQKIPYNNNQHYYYHEVSAFDGRTSPPHHDPDAILQPGQWRSINTYDGHVFHARLLRPNHTLGPVLLQHRLGLIPITNVFGHALEHYCDPNDPDIEPLVQVGPDHHSELAPEFRRSLRPPLRPCNTQDIGFRNLVGCPLHVYYSGMYNQTGVPRIDGQDCAFTPKSCHEEFKFHLGTNPYSNDFHWDWDSQTKFEGTYVGHNFVFRLQAKDEIVVDSVTVLPTYVEDCPPEVLEGLWLVKPDQDGFLWSLGNQEEELVVSSSSSSSRPGETPAAQRQQQHQQKLRGVGSTTTSSSSNSNHPEYDDEEF